MLINRSRWSTPLFALAVLMIVSIACATSGSPDAETLPSAVPAEDLPSDDTSNGNEDTTEDQNADTGNEEAPSNADSSDQEDEEDEDDGEKDYSDYTTFRDDLLDAIINRRYDDMAALMGDPFVIAGWRSEGSEWSPEQGAEQLRLNFIPAEGFIYYELFEDLTPLLDGQDPLKMWGPDVIVVDAIRFTGFGLDGDSEAIVVIALNDEGQHFWYSILIAFGGFEALNEGGDTPTPTTVPDDNDDLAAKQEELKNFTNAVRSALVSRDFDTLKGWMDDGLAIIGDPTGLYPEDTAAEALKDTYLLDTSTLVFGDGGYYGFAEDGWSYDFSDLLGYSIEDCCGNDVHIVMGIHITDGFGSAGDGEAILLIREVSDGVFKWYGFIEAPFD